MRALALALLALHVLAAGCALQSPPEREDLVKEAMPNLPLPPQWIAAGATAGPAGKDWLAEFNDPQLTALVREAIQHNPDLRVAASRVEQAAGYVKAAGATLYPQVQVSARGGGRLSGDSSGLQGVGIFANWELDLWGRVRASRESSQLQYASAELDRAYANQSIAALVAKSWFLAAEARLQRSLAQEMLASAGQLADLTQDRKRIGKGDDYELALARASLLGYRDSLQQIDYAYAQSLRALETLVGRYPAAALEVPARLVSELGPVPAGMPAELLERRPDVVAAERRVAAAFYRVEEAKAARLPRIALTASGSSVSSDLFVLKDHENPIWSVGASITAPIFLGGALQSQVEIRTAEQKIAVAEYGRIGARAFGEVESALSAGTSLQLREETLRQAVVENERAFEITGVRYKVGAADLKAVQQQQLSLQAVRGALLRVQGERLVQRINLHLALGGSFGD